MTDTSTRTFRHTVARRAPSRSGQDAGSVHCWSEAEHLVCCFTDTFQAPDTGTGSKNVAFRWTPPAIHPHCPFARHLASGSPICTYFCETRRSLGLPDGSREDYPCCQTRLRGTDRHSFTGSGNIPATRTDNTTRTVIAVQTR